jgi:putative DNA methylase
METFTRRNLPHWYVPGAAHFVTYRLYGTIPSATMRQWREERQRAIAAGKRRGAGQRELVERAHKLFFAKYDEFLDAGETSRCLADPRVAAMIRDNLYHHRGGKYHLLAYCIMPNHVHVLLQPIDHTVKDINEIASDEVRDAQSPLARIMHSLKSFTANRANELLSRTGPFWQAESYDHWVRDEDELERIVLYIHHNPVKAKLAARPRDWIYSSAHDRFLQDGFENGALLDGPVPR